VASSPQGYKLLAFTGIGIDLNDPTVMLWWKRKMIVPLNFFCRSVGSLFFEISDVTVKVLIVLFTG